MPPAHPSLELLLAQYERALAQLRAHFEGTDRKVAAVIVASGILIGLSSDIHMFWLIPGSIAVLAAGGFALWAYWPRKYPIMRPEGLRSYINESAEQTRLVLLDTYEVMIKKTEEMVAEKGRRLKRAFISFSVAAVVFAAGIVATAAQEGDPDVQSTGTSGGQHTGSPS